MPCRLTGRLALRGGLLAGLVAGGCADQVVGQFDSGGPTEGDATTVVTASGATAGDLGTTAESTGVPPSPEICDGLDNDQDGLVDEVSADLDACDGCQLVQGFDQAWWVCEAEKAWADAESYCETLGAHAGIVSSLGSQTFLHQRVGQGWFWLGARQDPDGGPWRWVDGTPFEYANWGTTQPDDTAPGQDCLRLTFGIDGDGWFDGAWDDFFCDDPHRVLCSAPHAAP